MSPELCFLTYLLERPRFQGGQVYGGSLRSGLWTGKDVGEDDAHKVSFQLSNAKVNKNADVCLI